MDKLFILDQIKLLRVPHPTVPYHSKTEGSLEISLTVPLTRYNTLFKISRIPWYPYQYSIKGMYPNQKICIVRKISSSKTSYVSIKGRSKVLKIQRYLWYLIYPRILFLFFVDKGEICILKHIFAFVSP